MLPPNMKGSPPLTQPIPEKAPLRFDFWATAKGAPLRNLIADIQEAIESREERARKRKPEDQQTFYRCVETLVANLALAALAHGQLALTEEAPSIGVSLGKGHPNWRLGRYSRHGLKQETFRKLLDAMDGKFLSFERSAWRGRASNIRPTPEFVEAVARYGVTESDIGSMAEGEETIVLTHKRGKGEKELVEYNDTPETIAMREEMAALNRYLSTALLAFLADSLSPPVCISQRRLSRRFILPVGEHPMPCASFAYGGRLYGGFWEHLSRERRRESLRINGERIAEADLNAVFLRLASAMGGRELDYGSDPYMALPGLQQYRRGLKGAIAALFFKPDLKRWPEATRKALPQGLTVKELRIALLQAFPGLVHCLHAAPYLGEGAASGAAVGYSLFRTESDILVAALRMLREEDGVVALPLHDAVILPASRGELAKRRLEQAARRVSGVRIPAKVWTASSG